MFIYFIVKLWLSLLTQLSWVLNGGGIISKLNQKNTLAIALAMSFALCVMPMASAVDNVNQMPVAKAVDNAKQNTISSDANANYNLQFGITDQKVTDVQKWLKNEGYYNQQIDGYFGIYTENGVKQFQKAAGIKVDGIVGPQTLKAMKTWDQNKAQVKTTNKKSQKITTNKASKTAAYSTSKKAAYATKKSTSSKSYRYTSRSGYINGMDCWAMSDYLAAKYRAMGYNPVIRHAVTSLSNDHRWVEVNGQPVSDYASLPWIYKPTG